jgi:glutathione S-transferase
VLTIYGAANSRASRNIWMALESELAFKHIPVIQASRLSSPLAPEAPLNTLSPDFREISPMGRIPVLVHRELVLHESLAINLHLARCATNDVGPADPSEAGLVEMWTLWAATECEPAAVEIIVNAAILTAEERDAAALAKALDRLGRRLPLLEAALTKGEGYLVGRRFTVADVNVAEVLRYAQPAQQVFEGFPAVAQWLSVCQARPAFRKMMEIREAEPLPHEWRKAYLPDDPKGQQ